MYRVNNISHIQVPKFANLTTGLTNYRVHITLHIKEDVANYIKQRYPKIEVFYWKGKWYISVSKIYTYNIPIERALYEDAYKYLTQLKILIREAKVAVLREEIKELELEFAYDD